MMRNHCPYWKWKHLFFFGLLAFWGNILSSSADQFKWRPLYEPGSGGWMPAIGVSPHDSNRTLLGGDMLGVGLSLDGGDSWESTFGFLSWEMADFTFHPSNPNEIWAGTLSGPYVSEDGGRNWRPSRQGFPPYGDYYYSTPVQKILFDPLNSSHLLAFGGSYRRWVLNTGSPKWGAVWESTDGGANWNQVSTIAGGGNVLSVCYAPNQSQILYAAVDQKGVLKSLDGGRSWTELTGLPARSATWISVHPGNPAILWVALGCYQSGAGYNPGGIWKSVNGGASWSEANTGLRRVSRTDANLASSYQAVIVSPSNPDVLYCGDSSWETCGTYRSDDGGLHWRSIMDSTVKQTVDTPFPAGPGPTFMTVDPHDPNHFFAPTSEYLLRTLDGGTTWKDVTIARVGRNPDRWRGTGYAGWCATNFKFNPYMKDHTVMLAMDEGKFWQSRDGLTSWSWGGEGMSHWNGGNDVTFAGPDGNTMFLTTGQFGGFEGIWKTTDGGLRWQLLAGASRGLPAANSGNGQQPLGIYALPDNPARVWACIGGKLYASQTGGDNWSPLLDAPGLTWIAADPSLPLTFYITGDLGVYQTTDGTRFELMSASPIKGQRIRTDPLDPNRIYVPQWRNGAGGLWRCDKGSWTLLRADRYIHDVAINPANNKRLAVITNDDPYHDVCFATGAWFSDDDGVTWYQQNEGLAVTRGTCIAFNPFNPAQVIVGTEGRGYFIAERQSLPKARELGNHPIPSLRQRNNY